MYTPRPQIPPEGSFVPVQIIGVSRNSYIYVRINDDATKSDYNKMVAKMEAQVKKQKRTKLLPHNLGTNCIVEFSDDERGVARGTVNLDDTKSEYTFCNLVDGFENVLVPRKNVFSSNLEVIKIPSFVIKCKLAEMDCFLGTIVLLNLYKAYLEDHPSFDATRCYAKFILINSLAPTVRLMTSFGQDFTNSFQHILAVAQKLQYPPVGLPIEVKITHYDNQDLMWFQPKEENQLFDVVKRMLGAYSCGILHPPKTNAVPGGVPASATLWRNSFFYGPERVFIYTRTDPKRKRTQHKKKCFRVQVFGECIDSKIRAFFLDYGNVALVPLENIQEAHLVDANLCFIPPQALPVRFMDSVAHQHLFSIAKFWKFVPNGPVTLILKKISNKRDPTKTRKDFPLADILIKNSAHLTTPEHSGYSLYNILFNNKL